MQTPSSQTWLDKLLKPGFAELVLLGIALILLLPGTATLPLMDRDEPRFAQATAEMMERGDWFIPTFNHEYDEDGELTAESYRFDKPVLSYWWMRVNYWTFGKSEFGARLHAVISTWLTGVVILAMGTFLYSRKAGMLAAIGWLTCFQVLVHGRLCVADMPMLLGVTMIFYALCRLLIPEESPGKFSRWFWMLAGGMILGFLAKGPITFAVPLLGVLLARWAFYRKRLPWMRLQPLILILLVLIGIGAWGIPALLMTEGVFWQEGIGEHVVRRGTEVFNGRVYLPVVFYLLSGFISLLPWSAFFPAALGKDGEKRRSLPSSLMLGFFVAPFIIFAAYATQLPHYVLPGFPAFFILLFRHGRIPYDSPKKWFWTVAGIFIGGSLLVMIGLGILIPWGETLSGMRWLLISGSGLVLMLSLSTLLIRYRLWPATGVALLLAVAGLTWFAHVLRGIHPVIHLKPYLDEAVAYDPEARFRAWGFTEPSLVFYSDNGWDWKSGSHTIPTAMEWATKHDHRTALFLLREWTLQDQLNGLLENRKLEVRISRDHEDEILSQMPEELNSARIEGFNAARSSWVEVLIVWPDRE